MQKIITYSAVRSEMARNPNFRIYWMLTVLVVEKMET